MTSPINSSLCSAPPPGCTACLSARARYSHFPTHVLTVREFLQVGLELGLKSSVYACFPPVSSTIIEYHRLVRRDSCKSDSYTLKRTYSNTWANVSRLISLCRRNLARPRSNRISEFGRRGTRTSVVPLGWKASSQVTAPPGNHLSFGRGTVR